MPEQPVPADPDPEESPALQDLLGVAEGAFDTADPVSLGRSLVRAMGRAARRRSTRRPPGSAMAPGWGWWAPTSRRALVGIELPGVAEPDPRDARFKDPTWQENLLFHGMLQVYLLTGRLLRDLVDVAGLGQPDGHKAEFAADLLTNAALAVEPAVHQPPGPEARLRDRRHERAARDPQLPARPGRERRLAAPGRPHAVRHRPQHRRHAGQGRLPQRAHRGHPVHPQHPRRVRSAPPRDPALDQPLLHRRPRARQEPGGVGRRPRAHHVRHQLPQPRRVAPRPHVRRLPPPRTARRDRRRA